MTAKCIKYEVGVKCFCNLRPKQFATVQFRRHMLGDTHLRPLPVCFNFTNGVQVVALSTVLVRKFVYDKWDVWGHTRSTPPSGNL
jgi:hypothetical protein